MKVKHTIQSPGNEPVTYSYTPQVDALDAIAAVMSIMRTDFSDVPDSVRPVTLSITVEY